MREIINFPVECLNISGKFPEKVNTLFEKALVILYELSTPRGIISEISLPGFSLVYYGEGKNEKDTPLDCIFRKADNLALFAVTLGERISQKITGLFSSNRADLGYALDTLASESTEKTAEMLERRYFDYLTGTRKTDSSTRVLRYSPGYCGWHISGQKKLFQYLHPEKIGITLTEGFIMQPIKSISGVMIAGRKEIHHFKDDFPFCKKCREHLCRERIKML